MPTPQEIITYLLPHVVTAGAYSAQIQSRVAAHEAKGGDTIFHHALSDADISIQGYLEVVLLARFPELHFFSEEQDQSLNRKYFAGTSALEVLLDPIDGTRAYLDGREFYQVIVTIHDEQEIVGVICYMPRRDRCYTAVKGEGAYLVSGDDMLNSRRGRRLTLTASRGPILLFNAPDLRTKLASLPEVKDLVTAYVDEPGRYHSTDLIEGIASAVVHKNCQAIDGGALSFIAAEGGAIVTHFNGDPVGSFRVAPTRSLANVVVAANPEIHRKILTTLAL